MQKHSLKDRIPKIHSHQCPKIPQSPNLVKSQRHAAHHTSTNVINNEVSLPYYLPFPYLTYRSMYWGDALARAATCPGEIGVSHDNKRHHCRDHSVQSADVAGM